MATRIQEIQQRLWQAARELLHTPKGERLVLDWRKQQRARAAVQVTA